MLAGAGTVNGRAAGALINAFRLFDSFDMFCEDSEGGSLAIKNEFGSSILLLKDETVGDQK
jgi:hypothetical protein